MGHFGVNIFSFLLWLKMPKSGAEVGSKKKEN